MVQHTSNERDDRSVEKSGTEARQGRPGVKVNAILLVSLGLVVIAFAIIYLVFV